MSSLKDKPNAQHGDEPKGSFLHIRVTRQQKANWVKQAQARGMKLRAWVCEKLDESVKEMIKKIYKPNSKEELKALCDDKTINLGEIDTAKITDMSYLFFQAKRTDYSGIEDWNVSKVKYMCSMFYGAVSFNQDISNWDVSNVKDMEFMFTDAVSFNQDISNWDISNVKDMDFMFASAVFFNQDISNWNVSNVEYMEFMFEGALSFNQDLSGWQLDSIKDKAFIFKDSPLEKLVETTQWDWSKYHEQSN